VDSVIINFPAEYTIESLPKNVTLNTAFGIYSMSFEVKDNNIYCVRSFEQDSFRQPVTEYKNYGSFLNNIYKTDRSRIVFLKK